MLQTAQKTSYTVLASANSEAEISSLDWHKARAAFNLCGFFCARSVLPYGWTASGAERLADFLMRRYC